jgi:hypothetical protein
MGLAQQVQSSLSPLDESRLSRGSQHRSKRNGSSISTSRLEENDEQYISKRLLNRRAHARKQDSYLPKLRIAIAENEQEPSTDSKKQDAGIWVILKNRVYFVVLKFRIFNSYFQFFVIYCKLIILLMHKNGLLMPIQLV